MRKTTIAVSSVLLLAALGGVCIAVLHIDSSLRTIRRQVGREGDLAFTLTPLSSPENGPRGDRSNPGFEPLSTPNTYTTGAAFAGKLYLAGPGGLAVYDHPDAAPKLLRTGLDLPPAPIVALAEGRLRGQSSSSLIAATHGEGLLLFSSDASTPPQQLRPAAAADRDITAVLPLASGDLLIGTRRAGLLLYDGTTLRLFQPVFAHVAVTALAGDEGDVWVGTRTRGVLHWRAGQMDAIGPSSGLPDEQVDSIATGPEGVFVGTPLGVAQFSGGHLARTLAPGLFVRALALDHHTLAVATIDQGLRTLALEAHAAPLAAKIAAGGDATDDSRNDAGDAAAQANDAAGVTGFFTAGDALLAVDGGHLLRRGPTGSWQQLLATQPQSLTADNVTSLSFAPDGRLWIGYFDRGVDVLDLQTNHAQHVEDDHVFCINRIVTDPQRHTMDVATANGLVLFDANKNTPLERQVLTRRDGLIADQVTDIAFSSAGMTVATAAGLTIFTASGPESLYSFQGLANNHVYALAAEPSSDRVFAGTLGGVSILDDETVLRNVTLKNSGLKRNWVTAIAYVPGSGPSPTPAWGGTNAVRDSTGGDSSSSGNSSGSGNSTWFVGTYGGSVVAMDATGHVTPLDTPAPSAVINPNALLETPHRVLAGSLDDGLLVYDRVSQRWSQILSGLPSRSVTALAERDGELYVGTENGIVRIAEAALP